MNEKNVINNNLRLWISNSYPFLALFSTISFLIIASSLIPISRQASNWNTCVNTTKNHLKRKAIRASEQEIKATAVVLCNGSSIPAKRKKAQD